MKPSVASRTLYFRNNDFHAERESDADLACTAILAEGRLVELAIEGDDPALLFQAGLIATASDARLAELLRLDLGSPQYPGQLSDYAVKLAAIEPSVFSSKQKAIARSVPGHRALNLDYVDSPGKDHAQAYTRRRKKLLNLIGGEEGLDELAETTQLNASQAIAIEAAETATGLPRSQRSMNASVIAALDHKERASYSLPDASVCVSVEPLKQQARLWFDLPATGDEAALSTLAAQALSTVQTNLPQHAMIQQEWHYPPFPPTAWKILPNHDAIPYPTPDSPEPVKSFVLTLQAASAQDFADIAKLAHAAAENLKFQRRGPMTLQA